MKIIRGDRREYYNNLFIFSFYSLSDLYLFITFCVLRFIILNQNCELCLMFCVFSGVMSLCTYQLGLQLTNSF